jgi:hypothetical protein
LFWNPLGRADQAPDLPIAALTPQKKRKARSAMIAMCCWIEKPKEQPAIDYWRVVTKISSTGIKVRRTLLFLLPLP